MSGHCCNTCHNPMNDAKFRVQSLSAKNRTIHVFPKNEVGEIIKCLSLSSCPARVLNEKRAEKLHHKEVSEQNKHIKEEQKKKKVKEKKSLKPRKKRPILKWCLLGNPLKRIFLWKVQKEDRNIFTNWALLQRIM